MSDIAIRMPTAFGPASTPKASVDPAYFLPRIRSDWFPSGLAALANHVALRHARSAGDEFTRRLPAIRAVEFAKSIAHPWSVAGKTVAVPASFEVQGDRIVLTPLKSRRAFRRSFASALAVLVDPIMGEQVLADAIGYLLDCRDACQLKEELTRRRIPWDPPGGS